METRRTGSASSARILFLAVLPIFGFALPVAAQTDGFFKGKQVRMVIPSGAGGGYDTFARVLSLHLRKHLPGNPSIVDQNMPGASGMLGTNWAATIAPKDGTVIVATYNTLLIEPMFGNKSVRYDPRDFEWIGSMGKQQQICVTWHTSPVKAIEQAREREIVVAATGATGNSATMPKQLNQLMGTKFRVVPGYSTTESRLSLERGESDGICGLSYSTLKAAQPEWIDNKRINVLVQSGMTPQKGLESVPLVRSFVKDANDLKVLDVLAFPEEVGRPFLMPPGTPKNVVQIVRRAFDATMKDPAFLADAEKARLDLDPMTGEEAEAIIKQAYDMPKELIERAAELNK